ncbi:acetate--CoA ligase family protein [Candidatus Marsarchaeota archaeon]|nr:acetate--CoA ligase family protein [Candidatus Marsarchaeota archaeon]MCL5404943.1 acetate--CoA ligase family protein [Candidatus Marsarchaeota archaeon]
MAKYYDLNKMMNPKSVAIIGASQNTNKIGHIIMQNYISMGYGGKIYPVNVNAEDTILGHKAFKSVLDIKDSVDLAVIAIPAKFVPQSLEECGKAKVKSVIIVSSGFAETGNADLQDAIVSIAKKYSLPVLGPNCLGVMDMYSRVDTMFLPSFKIDRPSIGGVSFASQSGAVGSTVLDLISHENFGLSKFISYGNAAVIDEADILNYLAHDPTTKVIIFYIEGVKRGKEFIKVAKEATKLKPVIIIKGGTTPAGSQAAHSHTASLAGSHQAYEAVFEQFGFIKAQSLDEMLYFAKIFVTQPLMTKNRIGVITNGGGVGVLAADSLYANGLQLAPLSDQSKSILRKVMPPIVNMTMPMDMAGDADDQRYAAAIDTLSNDPSIDALMVIALFQTPGADSRVAATIIKYGTQNKKPLVVVSPGGNYAEAHNNMMESSGVPVYPSPEDAAKALAALIKYSEYRSRWVHSDAKDKNNKKDQQHNK